MSLRVHECNTCGYNQLAFKSEPERLWCGKCNKRTEWSVLPLAPYVVHASSRLMVDYYLDSIWTLHEATSKSIREGDEEASLKAYQKAITT